MSSDRCAVAFGLGASLQDSVRAALEPAGYSLEIVQVDAGGVESTEALEDKLARLFPPGVSLLINGDALFPLSGDPDVAVSLGLIRSFSAVKVVLRGMVKQRFGRIINVAPFLDSDPLPHQAVRMGLGGLVKSVAREVGSRGITANVVAPGYLGDGGELLSPYVSLARPACNEDIASVIGFVAGDGASYLTGQILTVDGGLDTT